MRRLGIEVVAIYSDADRHALHVRQADVAVHVGGAAPAESYLNAARILEAARATGAQAIHPGYGFLSENAAFAESCEAAGIVFIGPTPAQMRDFGLKHRARELAAAQQVPLLPGSDLLQDLATARREAARIGYPVMLKSTAGGGGIGLTQCDEVVPAVEPGDVADFQARALPQAAVERVVLEAAGWSQTAVRQRQGPPTERLR